MTYNITFTETSTSFIDLIHGVNSASDNAFALLLLAVLFIIIFISIKNYDTKAGLLVSGFVTLLISILFYFIGFIIWPHLMIIIIFFIISVIILLLSGSD